jgi:hypothetical protein
MCALRPGRPFLELRATRAAAGNDGHGTSQPASPAQRQRRQPAASSKHSKQVPSLPHMHPRQIIQTLSRCVCICSRVVCASLEGARRRLQPSVAPAIDLRALHTQRPARPYSHPQRGSDGDGDTILRTLGCARVHSHTSSAGHCISDMSGLT